MERILIFIFAIVACTAHIHDHGNPDAFEGDIGLDPFTRSLIHGNLAPGEAFKGVINRQWPNGIIPYVFDNGFDQNRRTLMINAMGEFHKKTCVRFVPRNGHRDYIYMVNQNACWSIIGRGGGKQLLKMGNHCLQSGTAIHELMHAVGFYHEQSRNDRDTYVNIYWSNIQSGEDYNFNKYRSNYYNQPYDLNSIMHYRNTEFSRNGKFTIASKKNPSLALGNTYFSKVDVNAITAMYATRCGSSVCADKDGRCAYWARIGECKNNPNWMRPNCMKSCRLC